MEAFINFISQPWPWYVGGPLIGLFVPLALLLFNKPLGVSSSLQHICAMCVPGKIEYFNYDWKKSLWNVVFAIGIGLGAVIVYFLFPDPNTLILAESTVADLQVLGIASPGGIMPEELFSWEAISSPATLILLVLGGFLVGFGTRYANGCTSGHTIMGLSLLNVGSLVATIGFFIGGLISSWLLVPLIIQLL